MVWHIFKKDWRLLRTFVIAVALLHGIIGFILYKLGMFNEDPMLERLAQLLPQFAAFASMFLIAAIVHLDALPGVRQDWLARPIRRVDLLIEKSLFVLVMVDGPILIVNILLGLADGFSVGASVGHAFGYVAYLVFIFAIPIFAFASVTSNMTEAFILGCGCTLIIGAFLTLSGYLEEATHRTIISVTHSGIGWLGALFRFACVAVGGAVIVGLQYFRRKTFLARVFVVVFGGILLASTFLPWKPAWAIEQKLSPRPGAAAATSVAFDPGLERFKPPSGISPSQDGDRQDDRRAEVFLPLRIAGIGNDAVLLADRVDVRVLDSEGRVLYHGAEDAFEAAREGPQPKQDPVYQRVAIPMGIYRGMEDGDVQVKINYSLTLLGLNASYSVPALHGDERMPAWGWCQTQVNEIGTNVELRCMRPGLGPTCASVYLENMTNGTENPPRAACMSEYGPFKDPLPDDLAFYGVNLPFRDAAGVAKYPVDGPQLAQSRVIIRMYEPEEHFSRSVVIPHVRLKDWEAQ
ncbi:MAG TPA: hypothetical protein VKR52_12575 [Terracidiphilus sp.]|nr:hypothetical protein [Terracidiphilus sp.]